MACCAKDETVCLVVEKANRWTGILVFIMDRVHISKISFGSFVMSITGLLACGTE